MTFGIAVWGAAVGEDAAADEAAIVQAAQEFVESLAGVAGAKAFSTEHGMVNLLTEESWTPEVEEAMPNVTDADAAEIIAARAEALG